MHPLLHDGDIVYFKKIEFSKITTNDIFIIKKRNHYFTHRVIFTASSYLVTKGDSNPRSDGKIYPKQIVGKVEKVKRDGQVFNPDDLYLLQSTLYFQEIVKIKNSLQREKVDFVFLKGLPLHLYFEKTHPRRMYADCDVLISKTYLSKAKRILKKFGYKEIDTPLSKTLAKLKDKESEISFYKIINGFAVVFDVHLEVVFMMTKLGRLDPLYPQELIDELSFTFLKKRRISRIHNEDFPILSTENLFIYLCLHLFHHNFRGAYRYEFLNTLIKTNSLNYSQIAKKIHAYKLHNFIYPCILLLQKHYLQRFPKHFLASTEPKTSKLLFIKKNILTENIFDDEPQMHAGIERFKNLFFLAPFPLYKKVLVFLSPQVIYAILWVMWRKIFPER